MWNSAINRNISNIIKYGNSHPSALQKIKFLQRTQILKCCKNSIVHLRCTALYTNKTLQNIRKSSPIQNHSTLTSEDIRLNKNYLWDTLEINWDKIKISFNSNEIKLPQLVMIKMQDKIRVRRIMSREPQKFSYNDKTRNDVVQLRNSINSQTFYFRYGVPNSARV